MIPCPTALSQDLSEYRVSCSCSHGEAVRAVAPAPSPQHHPGYPSSAIRETPSLQCRSRCMERRPPGRRGRVFTTLRSQSLSCDHLIVSEVGSTTENGFFSIMQCSSFSTKGLEKSLYDFTGTILAAWVNVFRCASSGVE